MDPPGTFQGVSRRPPGHQNGTKFNLNESFSEQRPDNKLARVLSCITNNFNRNFMDSDRRLPGMTQNTRKKWRESCAVFYIISDVIEWTVLGLQDLNDTLKVEPRHHREFEKGPQTAALYDSGRSAEPQRPVQLLSTNLNRPGQPALDFLSPS